MSESIKLNTLVAPVDIYIWRRVDALLFTPPVFIRTTAVIHDKPMSLDVRLNDGQSCSC